MSPRRAGHLQGLDPALSVPGALAVGPLGLVAAAQIWLAFARPGPAPEAAPSGLRSH